MPGFPSHGNARNQGMSYPTMESGYVQVHDVTLGKHLQVVWF